MSDPAPLNEVTPRNIPEYRQHKIGRIARDFLFYFDVPPIETARILLARGIAKWMSVRRMLYATQQKWLVQVREAQEGLRDATDNGLGYGDRMWLKGYLYAKEECRADIDSLCKSGRWQIAQDDSYGRKLLWEIEHGNEATVD